MEQVNPHEVEELLGLARMLRLDSLDLDEMIYESLNENAANEYNNGAMPELDDNGAYEHVHNSADVRASEINNGGLRDQISHLIAAYGKTGAEDLLRRAADDRMARSAI